MKRWIRTTVILLASLCFCCDKKIVDTSYADSVRRVSDSLNLQKTNDSIALAKSKEELNAIFGKWEVKSFVDNFGDPTKDKYLVSFMEGKFSNSATSNSYLFVEILMTKKSAGIFLKEYDVTRPAQKFTSSVQIQMKNERDEKLILNTSGVWNQSGGIKLDNNIGDYYHGTFKKFRDFIAKSSGPIKVVIFDDYSSVYNFSINPSGFKDKVSKI